MDSDDSCSDLFITQSNFRTNVKTQEASDAAEFFNTSFDLLENSGEVVEYFDFSKEISTSATAQPSISSAVKECHASEVKDSVSVDIVLQPQVSGEDTLNVPVGQEPFIPLVPDLFDDHDVDQIPDDVLAAALDSVTADTDDKERHGVPVSPEAVQENSAKGYVSLLS